MILYKFIGLLYFLKWILLILSNISVRIVLKIIEICFMILF